jgi:hypothetical protein
MGPLSIRIGLLILPILYILVPSTFYFLFWSFTTNLDNLLGFIHLYPLVFFIFIFFSFLNFLWGQKIGNNKYHIRNLGHNIDTCSTFKRKLLQLFKAWWIRFEDTLNINFNPLPDHASSNGGVNVVEFRRRKKERRF